MGEIFGGRLYYVLYGYNIFGMDYIFICELYDGIRDEIIMEFGVDYIKQIYDGLY